MADKYKVLCVEDEELIRADLVDELTDAGYEAIPACNGLDAIEKLKGVQPDLILCDIMMPEMDGPALLTHVRATMPELARVPFIFLTARASRGDIIDGKQAGADDYLTKPLDFDMLLATLKSRFGEVERMTAIASQELVKLYQSIGSSQKVKTALKVSIVTGNSSMVGPISSALTELGCEVSVHHEETLKNSVFRSDHADVNFLIYGKIVHFWLKYLATTMHKDKSSKVVVLIPAHMSKDAREALMELGVDQCIEFPFRPVEIFKVIMERLSEGGKAVKPASSAAVTAAAPASSKAPEPKKVPVRANSG
ncbi:response regulator [Breoghania sp. L-A4]|uniref:response regulator n=1 Tax=Breoghania sp. L-A4 TaxID=2304600 RepID=UPI000E360CAF|nr:response regulator [Breoghania sp. L-A4]AXS40897.1 response regulator [Breoghania sp. L-A4]